MSSKLSIALVLGLALIPTCSHSTRRSAVAAIAPKPAATKARLPSKLVARQARTGRSRLAPRSSQSPPPAPTSADRRDGAGRQPAAARCRQTPLASASRARRRRADAQPAPIATEEPARQPSSDARARQGAGAGSSRPPRPSRTGRRAEPPKPDVWSDAEVIAALRECVRLLAPIAADVEVAAARQAGAVRHAGPGHAEAHRLRRQQGRDQPAGHAQLRHGGRPAQLGREDPAAGGARRRSAARSPACAAPRAIPAATATAACSIPTS